MFEETRDYLKEIGLPQGDLNELPTSEDTFPDGAHYRLEVPTINSSAAMETLLETAEDFGVTINRVDETFGIFRHTDKELKKYINIAKEWEVELNLSTGPRATYDTSATVLTDQGVRIGYRLRGMEQVIRAVEDIKRVVELGGRGILVYDEGFLWLLNRMRDDGELPEDIRFKLSAHCGHGNPAAFQVLKGLGADSINPVRDLQLPMIASLRKAVDVPLDVHTDNPPASGGFIRTYEAPEMVRIGSPIHLKTGNSAISGHGLKTTPRDAKNMAEAAATTKEKMEKYFPEAIQSDPGTEDMAIPV